MPDEAVADRQPTEYAGAVIREVNHLKAPVGRHDEPTSAQRTGDPQTILVNEYPETSRTTLNGKNPNLPLSSPGCGDERAYAAQLALAGIWVTYREARGMVHGFLRGRFSGARAQVVLWRKALPLIN